MSFCIAIDGPAAAGKGTVSKAVAVHFGFAHLDTGLLYRVVGAKVLAGAEPVAWLERRSIIVFPESDSRAATAQQYFDFWMGWLADERQRQLAGE